MAERPKGEIHLSFLWMGSLTNTILSGIFTKGPDYYGSEECRVLLYWTNFYFYVSLVTLICCSVAFCLNSPQRDISPCFGCVRILSGIFSFMLFIALWASYNYDEPCGSLRIYVLVVIIQNAVLFGLFGICFGMFCCLLTAIGVVRTDNNRGLTNSLI